MVRDDRATPGRRERRRLEIRARVLEAATTLFEEQGYDETPVSQICDRADIAYGTFFNHFPEKQDVLRMMAEQAITSVEEKLEELAKRDGSLEDHLVAFFENAAREYETDDRARRDLLGKIHAIAFTESPEDRDHRYHAAFERYLEESIARGRVRDDVPIETLTDVVASVVSSLSLSWVHFHDFPLHERAAAAARFLAESLEPRSER